MNRPCDWRDEHSCDHDGSRCSYCGCCAHTPNSTPCKVTESPYGMRCPERGCGCEGRS